MGTDTSAQGTHKHVRRHTHRHANVLCNPACTWNIFSIWDSSVFAVPGLLVGASEFVSGNFRQIWKFWDLMWEKKKTCLFSNGQFPYQK